MLQNAEMWWWPTISSQANVVWVSSFYCMQPQKFVGKYEAITRWKVFYVLLTTPPTKREEGTVVKKVFDIKWLNLFSLHFMFAYWYYIQTIEDFVKKEGRWNMDYSLTLGGAKMVVD